VHKHLPTPLIVCTPSAAEDATPDASPESKEGTLINISFYLITCHHLVLHIY